MALDKTTTVLRQLEKTQGKYWNISKETGEFLRIIVEMKKAKNILEIGTSNGYSGIHLGIAVKKNKGKLTTIDGDWNRATQAKENFTRAGTIKNTTLIIGEAREETKKLKGKFDLVFIDANKSQYLEYLKNIEKNLVKGSVIIADNAINIKDSMKDYIKYVTTSKKYDSVLVPIGSGEMISIKR